MGRDRSQTYGIGYMVTCYRRRDIPTPHVKVLYLILEKSNSAIKRNRPKGERAFWGNVPPSEGRGDVSHLPPGTSSFRFETIHGSGGEGNGVRRGRASSSKRPPPGAATHAVCEGLA